MRVVEGGGGGVVLRDVAREVRADLRVELPHDHVRLGARLLVKRLELRLHGGDGRLHLRLLRVGQLERVRQHLREVMWPVMMSRTALVVRTLRAEKLAEGERRGRTEREWNPVVCFHVVVCFY